MVAQIAVQENPKHRSKNQIADQRVQKISRHRQRVYPHFFDDPIPKHFTLGEDKHPRHEIVVRPDGHTTMRAEPGRGTLRGAAMVADFHRFRLVDLPFDFSRFISGSGELSRVRIALQTALHPWKIAAMIRFGRNCNIAAKKLSEFIRVIVPKYLYNANEATGE